MEGIKRVRGRRWLDYITLGGFSYSLDGVAIGLQIFRYHIEIDDACETWDRRSHNKVQYNRHVDGGKDIVRRRSKSRAE